MSLGAAVMAATEVAVPGVTGFNTIIPSQPTARRWFSIYPDGGSFPNFGLCNAGKQGVLRWQVNCFAPTEDEASWLAGAIRDYYLQHWISIPGWSDASVDHVQPVPARPDESVRAVPLVICTDFYSMTITKA